MRGIWPVHANIPVFSSNAGPDVIETDVTNEVDALGRWSRSGLGWVAAGSLTALYRRFPTSRWIVVRYSRSGRGGVAPGASTSLALSNTRTERVQRGGQDRCHR